MSSDFSDSNQQHGGSDSAPDIVDAVIVDPPDSTTDAAVPSSTPDENPLANVAADELSFLHPSSLVFDILAHGKTYLVPAAFGLWGAAQGDLTLLIISALIFVPAVMSSVFRYFTFRYCIKEDQLIVREGLVFRNVRTVPVSRIQNIDFVQNPLHRWLKVAEVKVETASGTKPEATLRVLSITQMEDLREAVFKERDDSSGEVARPEISSDVTNGTPLPIPANLDSATATKAVASTLLEIPVGWLIKAGLASNRGLIMIGVLIGGLFQFGDRKSFRFLNLQWFEDLFSVDVSYPIVIASIVVGLVIALVAVRLLGIGWFVLRFYNYQLVQRGDDLRISCGLFTRVSATVPRRRIQFISINRSLFMRMLGLASIRIETAGGAGQENENASESVSKRWFVPAIPEDRIPQLLTALRPELNWDESQLNFKPLAPRAGSRLCRLAIIQSIILAGFGMLIVRPWGWAFGAVLLPLLIMWALKKSKAMRYARMENGVVYRSGVFTRKISMTFFEKIQTIRLDQTPFDRRWGMARLSVDTAAAGPAEHQISVPYLEEEFAQHELQLLREKTGKEQPVFA